MNTDYLNQMVQFVRDEQSHIILNKELCETCTLHNCILCCPAQCYTLNEETGRVDVVYDTCLECGTCMVVCDKGAVDWSYPRGGYGVQFRLT